MMKRLIISALRVVHERACEFCKANETGIGKNEPIVMEQMN